MSATINVIPVNDFLNFLKENRLVIVSQDDYEANKKIDLAIKRERLMKKKAVPLSEIIDAKIFKYTTRMGLQQAIENGLLKQGEWFQETKGHNRIMVLTSALKKYM